jgi:coenzyme F420-dependent glucose-6-phosphate dehydrogenase
MATRPIIGWQASHEQFAPEELRRLAILAAQSGFQAIHSSDHFHPWSERQGHSGYSFAWLGAAMQVTDVPFGVICAPGYRYHPAVVAQAVATLARLFPRRLVVSLGSGEAINEHITGIPWPDKRERNARLHECATAIRRLLDGEQVNHHGKVTVADARIYSLPPSKVPLFGAALSPQTAGEVAAWADGLLTLHCPELPTTLAAFRSHGGQGKPVHVKVDVCYGESLEAAKHDAWSQWRTNVLHRDQLANVHSPTELEALSRHITPDQVADKVHVCRGPTRLLELVEELAELGVTSAIFHHVGRDQEAFIRDCGPVLCQ